MAAVTSSFMAGSGKSNLLGEMWREHDKKVLTRHDLDRIAKAEHKRKRKADAKGRP